MRNYEKELAALEGQLAGKGVEFAEAMRRYEQAARFVLAREATIAALEARLATAEGLVDKVDNYDMEHSRRCNRRYRETEVGLECTCGLDELETAICAFLAANTKEGNDG